MKIYDITRFPSTIELGYDGENNWRPQSFDCASLLKNHPNGVLTLWLLPHGETQAFPVALERDGNTIIWTPLSEEMTKEDGSLQVVCVDGSSVGKSDTAQYHVKGSLVPGAEHPSETPSWAVRVVEATGHYPKIENGNWYVWDVQNGEWSDTGVSAGGDVSPEQIESAVEDYLDEHPITVTETDPTVPAWAKQPNKPTYTAQEVGALPSDTPIPAAVTEQTVSGWGFTKNTGTYSKPSGGIPASDLAPGVIPVVPQMATKVNTIDWTSGKTVDAAVLKTTVMAAELRVSALEDGVSALVRDKADASDIPTAVSELTNDSGFQTAAQVQTYVAQQIAAIPDELPTVTATDNGKFLRVVSGAWAAASVPSAEYNSFGGGA